MLSSPLTLPGICWPLHATVGNIAVTTNTITGHFRAGAGLDGLVLCDLSDSGKFRNGAVRHWCRTHQCYWGTQSDLADLAGSGRMRCKLHASPMGYLLYPLVFDIAQYHAITLTHDPDGGLRLEAKADDGGALYARNTSCLAIACSNLAGLFPPAIVQINITPAAAQSYAAALHNGEAQGCSDCAHCGHPHLDLGEFALRPHRRHTCGYCGYDASYSSTALVSTPLQRLGEYALRTPGRISRWF